jgi:hypothetical protein
MEIIKLLLPVVTFALGWIFTWELKTADIENQSLKTSVGEVCRLCKEWYTQSRIWRFRLRLENHTRTWILGFLIM